MWKFFHIHIAYHQCCCRCCCLSFFFFPHGPNIGKEKAYILCWLYIHIFEFQSHISALPFNDMWKLRIFLHFLFFICLGFAFFYLFFIRKIHHFLFLIRFATWNENDINWMTGLEGVELYLIFKHFQYFLL